MKNLKKILLCLLISLNSTIIYCSPSSNKCVDLIKDCEKRCKIKILSPICDPNTFTVNCPCDNIPNLNLRNTPQQSSLPSQPTPPVGPTGPSNENGTITPGTAGIGGTAGNAGLPGQPGKPGTNGNNGNNNPGDSYNPPDTSTSNSMSTSPISPPNPSTTNTSGQSDDRSGVKIAAGIVGSIISLLIAAGIIIYYRRKREKSKENSTELSITINDESDMISNVATAAKSADDNNIEIQVRQSV
ncbi:7885_t:CDS:2 [Cetraspora pellucida]|uniref:7885_t:CDS:1 n=1 Tax=Cetraspora pellucida TaxID=1433469 RepID=A0A9N9AV61_9GLOM|nr:7885_t:CDS:2 [Cetraspora pellucida]